MDDDRRTMGAADPEPAPPRKKIAIIGGGIAGAGAAWLLQDAHEVTLFEANDRLGGHVRTAEFRGGDPASVVPVDLGVIVINPYGYPNIAALHRRLGIATEPVMLSVQACFGPDGGHWGNDCHDTPLFRELEAECRAFEDALNHRFDVPMTDLSVTLGAYCDRLGLSRTFREKALAPLLAVLQVTRTSFLETPVVLARWMMLSFFGPPSGWRRIEGGTAREIEAIARTLSAEVRLSSRVTRVQRGADAERSVTVHWDGGPASGERFDEVILTCSLDLARELIEADVDEAERAVLAPTNFAYEPMRVFLHTDLDVITRGTPDTWMFQYNHTERGRSITQNCSPGPISEGAPLVTYCFDESAAPSADKVHESATFAHLLMTPASCAAVIALRSLSGRRHTWYAGHSSALVANGHETAFVSALVVAEALGVPYPFREDAEAERAFRETMLVSG